MKLVDGERGVDQQIVYFSRPKLQAGEYLLFYRCAFKDPPYGGGGIGGTGDLGEAPGKKKSDPKAAKMDEGQMQSRKWYSKGEIEMDSHTERKLVVSINYPKTARIEV